jgi:sugar phosphate isomerase/epimerase
MRQGLKSEVQWTRRRFIQSSTVAAAALPLFGAVSNNEVLPIGFSTLGCPAWDWRKILDFAQQNGFAAVELRGIQGNMDLPSRPEFAPEHIDQSKKEVAARGLRISCVSSSANMHDTDPEKHAEQIADAKRFIDLAASLAVPYVRVFGNKIVGTREMAIKNVAQSLRTLGDYAGPKGVTVLIESHGDFTDSATLRAIF